MKKQKITVIKFILLFLIIVMLLTSCKGKGFSFRKKSDAVPELNYRKGTAGIEVKFLKAITPSEVDEGERFNIGMEVINQGSTDVETIHFILSGFDREYFKDIVPPSIDPFSLNGKSKYDPYGEKEIISFNIKNEEVPSDKYKAVFLTTVCYQYRTIATADICIVTDIAELTKLIKPPCAAKDSVSLSSQGAPVAVTKVEPRVYKEKDKLKADFKIHVENKGKGSVRLKNAYDKECTGSGALTKADINNVSYDVYLGNNRICSGTYKIRKSSFGKKEPTFFKCSTTLLGNQESYLTFLRVSLDYGYVKTESKKITMRKYT